MRKTQMIMRKKMMMIKLRNMRMRKRKKRRILISNDDIRLINCKIYKIEN